jgi:hypothetical protein
MCLFLRKSTKKKGEALVQHVFNVTETRSSDKISIEAQCVRQASVTKVPYKIELILDTTRTVTSALCSCVSGTQGRCKHTAAVITFVNSEREESKTDKQCSWQAPSSRGKSLYPKGETIDSIFFNSSGTDKLDFRSPSNEEIKEQIKLMEQNNVTNSMLYRFQFHQIFLTTV